MAKALHLASAWQAAAPCVKQSDGKGLHPALKLVMKALEAQLQPDDVHTCSDMQWPKKRW